MKRLTRKETIVVRGKETAACNYENDDCNDQCRYGTCKWQEKANMLLKRYEDTGLTPEQIMELKERDTEKSVCHYHEEEKFRAYCPTCKRYIGIDFKEGYRGTKNTFCPGCGQRVKWED